MIPPSRYKQSLDGGMIDNDNRHDNRHPVIIDSDNRHWGDNRHDNRHWAIIDNDNRHGLIIDRDNRHPVIIISSFYFLVNLKTWNHSLAYKNGYNI